MTNRVSRVSVVKMHPKNQKRNKREKSANETTDDEEDKDLEVDEKIPYSSSIKSKKNSDAISSIKRAKRKSKQPIIKAGNMVKKVPNFFGIDSTDNESEHEIESAYTELARKLFLQKLEGKDSDIYGMMTNDFKLRSVIEKKHASRKNQTRKDSKLFKKNKQFDHCDRDKRLSVGIYSRPHRQTQQIKTAQEYDMERHWKTQTYQKIFSLPDDFETIIERPYDEQYGTASHKRIKRKQKNFHKFYDKEMNFMIDKYNYITSEQAKIEEKEIFQYKSLRDSPHLMSHGSRKILHNRMKTTIILNNDEQGVTTAGFTGTPVHERLYADDEVRRKKIEELKHNYRDYTQEGSFINASSNAKISLANQQPLRSYKSAESILITKANTARGKITDSLKKTIENQSVERSARHRLLVGSHRENYPASMVITSDVSNKLYEDAKRRQSQKNDSIQRNRKREKSVIVHANTTSIKFLKQRFIKDFEQSIKEQGGDSKINYFTASEVLKDMGFVANKSGNETNEERIMFVDFWRCLKGDENEGVLDHNLKIFLGAVEGFMFNVTDGAQLNRADQIDKMDKLSVHRDTPTTSRRERQNLGSSNKK
jgi:hypothetical protein